MKNLISKIIVVTLMTSLMPVMTFAVQFGEEVVQRPFLSKDGEVILEEAEVI